MAAIFPPSAYRVYVAFGAGPLVVSPTWTDVTAWWEVLSVTRGRSSELEDFQAGSCTVTLDNRDRRFDPTHASGPYFGDLLPRTQIKVEAVVGATTYPVFRGHVTSWRQSWAYDDGQLCVVTAADAFALLASRQTPDTAHAFAVSERTPTSWWRLGDGDDTVRDVMSRAPGQYGADRVRVDPLEPGGDGASRTVANPGEIAGPLARVGGGTYVASTASTVTAILRVDLLHAFVDGFVLYDRSFSALTADNYSAGAGWFDLHLDYSGKAAVHMSVTGGNLYAADTVELPGAQVHHLAATRDGATIRLYVDGVEVDSTTVGGATGAFSWARGATIGDGPTGTTPISGIALSRDVTVDEVVLWQGTALDAAVIETLATAAFGWRGDSVSDRVGRILAAVSWPTGLTDLAASSTGVAPFVGGADALSIAQRTARSEQGRLFVARDGKVTYRPPDADYGAAASVTFSDGASGVRYSGYALEMDDRFVFNVVSVTGRDVEHTSIDTVSQAAYGPLGLSIETDLPTAPACRDLADRLLARYAAPAVRGSSWQVDPVDDAQIAAALDVELGDIVDVVRTPPVGSAHTSTQQIVAITHSASSGGTATVTFTGAPVDTQARFEWGASAWGGSVPWR